MNTKLKLLIYLLVFLAPPTLRAQTINESNFQTILISGSGRPLNANTAVCTLGLTTTGASISGNVATLTFGSNPQTAGYLRGSLLTVSIFTGADAIFNGTFPIAAVSSTTISYFLVHAPATASSVGLAFQTGTQGNPCAPLATIFTDYSGATQAPNPSTSGPLGNVSIWAPSGVYNLQYYGLGIVTKVIAFSIGGTGGGGGSGSPNIEVSFANVTSATLNASSLNTTNLLFQCYDNGSPNANPIETNASLNLSTLVITFGFTVPQSGYCAVNGSGGGGGSGPTVGAVLLNPIITQPIVQPPGTSLNVSGTMNAQSLNGVLNAAPFSGADIFAKANAAYASCSNACSVFIPAGTYNAVTTTLNFPIVQNGTAALHMEGVVINYTGSGKAISLSGTGQFNANAQIFGGTIIGTSAGAAGVFYTAFSGVKFYNLTVSGFTTGDGFQNAGANTIDCFGCGTIGNANGRHNLGAVVAAVNYSAVADHWHGGLIANNTNQGWFEDGSLSATVGRNASNSAENVVFEPNGQNGSNANAQIFLQVCDNCIIRGNFFENAPGTEPTNSINLGDSTFQPVDTNITDNTFGSLGATTTINDFHSFGTHVQGNIEGTSVTNFYLHGTLSRNSYIGCNYLPASTVAVNGVDSGNDTLTTCMATNQTWLNASAPGVRGYQYNQLSGYNQDLTIRTRSGGTNNLVGTNSSGVLTYTISDAGIFNNQGMIAGGTQRITAGSSCGTVASAVGGAWAGAFNSGISGTCTIVVTPGFTAPNGFNCDATDLTTTADKLTQIAYTTTTCTFSGTTASADAITWKVQAAF